MNPLKQVIGIDCGQKELVCRFGELTPELKSILKASKTYPNTTAGIESLIRWAGGLDSGSVAPIFVVEATGIYHQKLAYGLYNQGKPVVVVLPSRASSERNARLNTQRKIINVMWSLWKNGRIYGPDKF
jgi:transposase